MRAGLRRPDIDCVSQTILSFNVFPFEVDFYEAEFSDTSSGTESLSTFRLRRIVEPYQKRTSNEGRHQCSAVRIRHRHVALAHGTHSGGATGCFQKW